MSDEPKNINIEGDLSAWLANVGGTIIIHGDLTLNQWRDQQPGELRAQTDEPVFISYSRANTDFARELYVKLRVLGFTLWRDCTEMEAGENWWAQIQTAIQGSKTMVLCMSPEALASPIVAEEWRHARRKGTRVIPVLVADVDFKRVPRWMKKLDGWLDFREGAPERDIIWTKFINQLNKPLERRPVPFNVPLLPAHFVQRPDVFDTLLAQLLDADRQNPIAVTTALRGGGGFGKTTMAMALCHDQRVRDAFDDGVLWVEFGETPDLLRLLNTQIRNLDGQGAEIDINTAAIKLRDLLEDKDILLVLDDVWNTAHARHFLPRTEKTRIATLITTRLTDVVNASGAIALVEVDEMTSEQSVELLASGLTDTDAHRNALQKLAERLGEWALMLELANGVLRKQTGRYDIAQAIQRINQDLDDEGFTAFDSRNAESRNQSIEKSLNVSLNLLDDEEQGRFIETVIFPEDDAVPVTTLAKLWAVTERAALRLCETLADLSLARFDPEKKTIRLHDVVRKVLMARLDNTVTIHARLINNWGDLTTLPDEYAWRNVAYHLVEAERKDTLRSLLLDYAFLQGKLDATDPNAVISDCDELLGDGTIELVQSAFTLSAHVLNRDRRQFASQIYGRLLGNQQGHPALAPFLRSAKSASDYPAFLPLFPTLNQAGGPLFRTIPLHGQCNTMVFTDDGEYAIVGAYNHINVFELNTGRLISSFNQALHNRMVTAIAVQGEIVISGDNECMVKAWRWTDGTSIAEFSLHDSAISALAIQGSVVAAGDSRGNVKAWNLDDGTPLAETSFHKDRVTAVVIQEEVIISGSDDATVKVWRWRDGSLLTDFTQHEDKITAVAVQNEIVASTSGSGMRIWRWTDGALQNKFTWSGGVVFVVKVQGDIAVTGDGGSTVRVWRWRDGKSLAEFALHTGVITAVTLRDELIVSGSCPDNTVRLWHWKNDTFLTSFKQHSDIVDAVALQADVVVSGSSSEQTVKVWSLENGELLVSFARDANIGKAVAVQGEIVVATSGRKVKVWNWKRGILLTSFIQHVDFVYAVAIQGEIAVSGSYDGRVNVWRWKDGALLCSFALHTGFVNAVAIKGDLVVSGAADRTVKVWHWRDKRLLSDFTLHSAGVYAVAIQGDIVVSGDSGTLAEGGRVKVWRWADKTLITDFTRHTRTVTALAIRGDVVFSGSDDGTVKAWNWDTGEVLATFTTDTFVRSIAVSTDQKVIVAGDFKGHVHVLQPNAALRELLAGNRGWLPTEFS